MQDQASELAKQDEDLDSAQSYRAFCNMRHFENYTYFRILRHALDTTGQNSYENLVGEEKKEMKRQTSLFLQQTLHFLLCLLLFIAEILNSEHSNFPPTTSAHLISALSSMMKLAQEDTTYQVACIVYIKGAANCGMYQERDTIT